MTTNPLVPEQENSQSLDAVADAKLGRRFNTEDLIGGAVQGHVAREEESRRSLQQIGLLMLAGQGIAVAWVVYILWMFLNQTR